MAFIKNRFNRVFCTKKRTISPCIKSNCMYFCDREVHDPYFDCCMAAHEIDQIQAGHGSKNNNNQCYDITSNGSKEDSKMKRRKIKKRPKSSKMNRPSSANLAKVSPYSHVCSNDLMLTSSSFGFNSNKSKSLETIQSLCDQLEGVNISKITPRLTKLFPTIPEHDKKILNRMAMRRTKDLARREDAVIARKYWDAERSAREHLLHQQHMQLVNVLKVKRKQESIETAKRLQTLSERHQMYLDQVKKEISTKNQKLMHRLHNSELKKELKKCERRQEELQKFAAAAVNQEESRLDDALKKQECYSQLEGRITRAGAMRNYFLNVYRRRLYEDNELEKALHAANYEEAKKAEQYKVDMLKNRLQERDRKCVDFIERKQRCLNDSRNQARTTAELRDLVQRSISPDNYSYRGVFLKNDRPISNMSLYESNVRLG